MIVTRWIRAWAARKPAPATAAGQYRGRPGPRGEREAGHEEGRADILDEMRVKGSGSGGSGDALVPERSGEKHRQPVKDGWYCENRRY